MQHMNGIIPHLFDYWADTVVHLLPLKSSMGSVTRSGEFLDFGQLFKAFGNNLFPLISQHSLAIFVKVLKSIIFLVKSFLGNF